MEAEAPNADEQHIEECKLTCQIVSVLATISDALDCKMKEKEVGQTVDDLGGVSGGIIILCGL